MNRDKVRAIQAQALKLLAPLLEQGLKVSIKGASFADTFTTIKFEFAEISASGTVETEVARNFRVYARMYGLAESDLGRTFTSRGELFTISGLKPRCSKFPILATNAAGKQFKFPADGIKANLAV